MVEKDCTRSLAHGNGHGDTLLDKIVHETSADAVCAAGDDHDFTFR